MTIEFRYDKKQVLQALRYHFLTRPEIRILLILINVFAILSAVLFALSKIQAFSFLVFSILWFCLMLVIWRILPSSIYKRSATFRDHFIMHLESEKIVLETERGAQGWGWERFSHFVESPYFFHLYFDPRSFFLIPKDSFSHTDQISETRHLFQEKIRK